MTANFRSKLGVLPALQHGLICYNLTESELVGADSSVQNGTDSTADTMTNGKGHWMLYAVHVPLIVTGPCKAEGVRSDAITPGTRTRILSGAGAMAPGGGGGTGWPFVFTVTPGTFTLTLACCRLRALTPNHNSSFKGPAHDPVSLTRSEGLRDCVRDFAHNSNLQDIACFLHATSWRVVSQRL